jgi:hypothetical protein
LWDTCSAALLALLAQVRCYHLASLALLAELAERPRRLPHWGWKCRQPRGFRPDSRPSPVRLESARAQLRQRTVSQEQSLGADLRQVALQERV